MQEIAKPRTLRQTNRKAILNLLRTSGEISVAEISRKVKLSKTTIIKILNYYIDKGFVVNMGKGNSTDEGGKKPTIYKFNDKGGYVLSFHIFPDQLYSAVADLRVCILNEIRLPIDERETVDGIVEKIVSSYYEHSGKGFFNEKSLIGIAVGAHGITNYREGVVVSSPHFPQWGEDFNLKELIRKKIPYKGPIYIDNQIRFQVFAEKVLGLAKNKRNIIAIEGGVGLVAGVVVKNEITRGAHNLAGEIGHMILNPHEEERCACGGKGCFETLVSIKRMLRLIKDHPAGNADSLLFKTKGLEEITVYDVFDAANSGDALAKKIMDDVIEWFSIGISNLILAYDPEIIIIQGIFTKAGSYFISRLRERVNKVSLLHINKNVQIEYSRLGSEVGILGSAAFTVSEYFK